MQSKPTRRRAYGSGSIFVEGWRLSTAAGTPVAGA